MNNIEEKYFEDLKLKTSQANELALGYPVNREHSFTIDITKLGIVENSLATTYLNNIASPYYHNPITKDNCKDLEVALMKLLANHFTLDVNDSFGYVTYGGTEANFAALWWHRNFFLKKENSSPIIFCSERSHYSIAKISNQLQVDIVKIKADQSGIDLDHFVDELKKNNQPVIFVANFSNTSDGAIDDLVKIHGLLTECKGDQFKIHLDGAIYGLMAPYIRPFSEMSGKGVFDYADTLSFSGHKFLGAYNISGVILTKQSYIDRIFDKNDVQIPIIHNAIDVTVSGSREGFFVLELYLLIKEALSMDNNGETKLHNLWKHCCNQALWFYNELKKITLDDPLLHYNPEQLSVLVPAPKDPKHREFLATKYALMAVDKEQLGIYVFPRSTQKKLNAFLIDYKKLYFM